jgi:hypothetical protein
MTLSTTNPWRRRAVLPIALLVLNVSLAFVNVWPTPWVTWKGDLSVELAAFVLILAILGPSVASPSRRLLTTATVAWMVMVLTRYADATASALFGRDINLYWDARFLPDVTGLFVRAAPVWAVAGVVIALLLVLVLLAAVLRWALRHAATIGDHPRERWALGGVAAALLLVFAFQPVRDYETPAVSFATPIVPVYVRQARLAVSAMGGPTTVAPSPPMDSDLARVRGADVFVIFLESYGAVTYDRPSFDAALTTSRSELARAIADTNRDVISAYVESPTFGGGSWLAHISLLSGVEVRTPDTNAVLMTEKRDTLVTAFARRGYRTIALMPGLWQRWPEGVFYGFDEIYGGERLAYGGPSFGWFDVPDQFTLAALDALEPPGRGQPTFVVFPTISTHTPFHPLPPYQPDWARLVTGEPFDAADIERAFSQEPDWEDLGPNYVNGMAYAYAIISGYLRKNAGRDAVFVVLGDHQPPALVTGVGAPWDVPVHIIASRRPVLDRLLAHGFRPGLAPARPDLGPMHTLLPMLLDAFGDR